MKSTLPPAAAEAGAGAADLEAGSGVPLRRVSSAAAVSRGPRRQLFSMEQWHIPFSRNMPTSSAPVERRDSNGAANTLTAATTTAVPAQKRKLMAALLFGAGALLFLLFTVFDVFLLLVGLAVTSVAALWRRKNARKEDDDDAAAAAGETSKEMPVFEAHHAQTVPSRIEFVSRSLLSSEEHFSHSLTHTITSCVDADTLTQFKSHLDVMLRAQGKSLHHIIFDFVPDAQREILLSHFSAVHSQQQESGTRWRMVLSDIDDTLMPSLKDFRGFSSGVPYPGVAAFLKALACGESRHVSFVTARPAFLRKWTKKEIAKAGFGDGLLLMGSTRSASSPSGMMENKLKQVREMRKLWPECDIVLVGDNGQKDIDLGKALLREKLAEAVFIHDIYFDGKELPPQWEEAGAVGGDSLTAPPVKIVQPSQRAGYRQEECGLHGITLFPSYAAAAVMAKRQGLIGSLALEQVARACAEEFGQAQYRKRLADALLRDIGRVINELDHRRDEERVEFLHFVHEAIAPSRGRAKLSRGYSLRRMASSNTLQSQSQSFSIPEEKVRLMRLSESSPEFPNPNNNNAQEARELGLV